MGLEFEVMRGTESEENEGGERPSDNQEVRPLRTQ